MNKKLMLLFVGIILFACNFLFPPKQTSTPEVGSSGNYQDPTSIGFTIVRLHPKHGNLKTMLAEEAQKAVALDQIPVVEFDATWCPPCQAIDAAIESRNDLILKAYSGTYIIRLDVDEWGWGDSWLHNFQFDAIPVYFKLDAQGNQTGEVIDGGVWGEDIPENIAPVMDKFFHGN
jgi:thiol:disulfide interchange protein